MTVARIPGQSLGNLSNYWDSAAVLDRDRPNGSGICQATFSKWVRSTVAVFVEIYSLRYSFHGKILEE